MRKPFKHLKLAQRLALKERLEQNVPVALIAKELGYSRSAIYGELKRYAPPPGMTEYDPYKAEAMSKSPDKRRGRMSMLQSDTELAYIISKLIIDDEMSVPQVTKYLKKENARSDPPSINTIYAAIDGGLIPNVSRDTLKIYQTKMFSDGSVHIPKWVREKYGYKDGDEFSVEVSESGEIQISRISKG